MSSGERVFSYFGVNFFDYPCCCMGLSVASLLCWYQWQLTIFFKGLVRTEGLFISLFIRYFSGFINSLVNYYVKLPIGILSIKKGDRVPLLLMSDFPDLYNLLQFFVKK